MPSRTITTMISTAAVIPTRTTRVRDAPVRKGSSAVIVQENHTQCERKLMNEFTFTLHTAELEMYVITFGS